MGILDWFKRTGQKKQRAEPIALVAPWRREVLGVIYCSDVCYENAGRGMLASHGKSKPCCFCQTEVTYGHSGIVYMPFLTEPNLVCAKCHEKAEHWNATQKECALCGKACDARPVTAADNSNKIQNSVSSTEANLFEEAMRLYRESQPQYEPDSLSFPSFNKEKLAKAFESFFDCHGIDASLMKAQCIYDEGSSSGDYGPAMLEIAMNNIDLAIQKNPNNPRAYDIRGFVFYAMYSKDDKERALELAIENSKKALELDPQYSSDFGTRISTRATTNTAFRENLNGLERSLEELRLEKQLPAEAQEETRLPNNRIESNEEIGNGSVQTAEGKAAYQLAGEIAETRAVHRWKELMDLYYASKSPAAKIEVVRIASSLALASDILEWKMEVNLKANELKQMGKWTYPIEEEAKLEIGVSQKDDHTDKIVSETIKHCERCGETALRQSQFLDECGRAGLEIMDGNLFGGRNDQKKVEIYRRLENRKGFRCSACSSIYCMSCLFNFAPVHANGGKACFKCNGRFELFHD